MPDICGKVAYNTTEVAENMNDVNFGATGFVCLKCSGECEKVANTNGEANKPNKKASEFEHQVSYVIDTAYSDTMRTVQMRNVVDWMI